MSSFGIGYVFKMIASLIVIIVAINVLLKKMNTISQKNGKSMRVIERMSLSRSSSICVVEICGKYYLMSCTEQHNEILQELDASDWEVNSSEVATRSKEEKIKAGIKMFIPNKDSNILKKESRNKSW